MFVAISSQFWSGFQNYFRRVFFTFHSFKSPCWIHICHLSRYLKYDSVKVDNKGNSLCFVTGNMSLKYISVKVDNKGNSLCFVTGNMSLKYISVKVDNKGNSLCFTTGNMSFTYL